MNLTVDGFLILEDLTNLDYKFKPLIFNLDIFNLIIYNNKQKIILWCGYKLIPDNLKNLTQTFNLSEFKEIESNNEKKTTNFSNNFEWDLKILKHIILYFHKFTKKFQINHCKNNIYSASGFAYKCFFKCFNQFNIAKTISEDINMYIRDSYFGGRCEVFGNPNQNDFIYYIDFIGMYSQCMKENFPIGDGYFIYDINDTKKPGFYDLTYISYNMEIPILPHKKKKNQKLMFCNGEGRGLFWYEEIDLFLKNGGIIIKIHAAYIFNNTEKVFEKYIHYFENYKQQGLSFKKLGKLYINALYGRLGMDKSTIQNIFIDNEKELNEWILKKGVTKINKLNKYWIVEYDTDYIKNKKSFKNFDKTNFHSNVIYASIITSKARVKLTKTLLELKQNGHKLLYCDTDSIYLSSTKILEFDKNIYNVNIKIIKDAVFISPKCYALKYEDGSEDCIIKGVKLKITFDELKHSFFKKNNLNNITNYMIFKNNYLLEQKSLTFNLDLNNYDKRKFINNFLNTKAFFYLDGLYI